MSLEMKEVISSDATADDDVLTNDILDDIDYDALYEEADNDNEDVDMKNHGSVITHLLSQVCLSLFHWQQRQECYKVDVRKSEGWASGFQTSVTQPPH